MESFGPALIMFCYLVYKILDKTDKVSYVNIVFLVSDVKVLVDAELVDVRDDSHVRNAILRFDTWNKKLNFIFQIHFLIHFL